LDASTGGGWKKGKIRLQLEFIPDEPVSENQLSDLERDRRY
jgi:hypothetical protein